MKIIRYMKYSLVLILMALLGINQASAQKKCLVISVDGLTPFAISSSYTPNIDALMGNGTYTFEGQTLAPTYDAPGWTSLLTGVWYTKHGVTSESMENYDSEATPDLFSILQENMPNLATAVYLRSDTIATYLAVNAGTVMVFDTDDDVAAGAAAALGEPDVADFTMVQIDTTNRAGQRAGFEKTVSEYVLALQYADELLGQITDAVYDRSEYDNEEWMIILVSNHGGTPDGQIGGNSAEEKTIPVAISGDDIPNGEQVAKEGEDNALQLLNYRPGNPGGTYGGIFGYYHPTLFKDLTDMTIEFEIKQWFKRGGWQSLFDIGNDGTLLALQGEILKTYGRCGTKTVSEDFRFSIGVNYHMAFTIEGGTWKVFVNGEKIGELESCDPKNPKPYGIGFGGGLLDGYAPNPLGDGENFLGIFNEVRIWDVALPDDVIAAYGEQRDIEDSDHPYLETENLKVYWKLDEVDGNKLEDFSGNNHHGVVNYWRDGADPERLEYKWVPAAGFQLIDIMPTVLSFLGLDLDPEWDIDGVPFEVKKVILGPQNDDWNVIASKHYPNPVMNNITIVIPEVMMNSSMLTVANAGGVLMTQKSVSGNEIQLGVSHFDSGIYFYSLKDGNNVVLGKFIVSE